MSHRSHKSGYQTKELKIPDVIKTGEEPSFAMCTRCGACTMACPTGALTLQEIDK